MRIVLFLALSTLPSSSTTAASLAVQTVLDTARATGKSLGTIETSIKLRDEVYSSPRSSTPVSTSADSEGSDEESVSFPDLKRPAEETIPPDLVPDSSFSGHYTLKRLVAHEGSVLLIGSRTVDSKEVIFKYQTNCLPLKWNAECLAPRSSGRPECGSTKQDTDALLHEYAFTKIVSELRLAPEPFVISPPVLVTGKSRGLKKSQFGLYKNKDTSAKACRDAGATVRVLVEERVGPTISDLFKKDKPLSVEKMQIAAKIFHKSLIMLEKIHFRGIVHGDFHFGNIAFRGPVPLI